MRVGVSRYISLLLLLFVFAVDLRGPNGYEVATRNAKSLESDVSELACVLAKRAVALQWKKMTQSLALNLHQLD